MKENYQIYLPYQFHWRPQSVGGDPQLPHKKMKTLFLSNMSKSRRLTSTFFPTINTQIWALCFVGWSPLREDDFDCLWFPRLTLEKDEKTRKREAELSFLSCRGWSKRERQTHRNKEKTRLSACHFVTNCHGRHGRIEIALRVLRSERMIFLERRGLWRFGRWD